MTVIQAARNLRDQFRAQGQPCPWSECMRIAAQCRDHAQATGDAKRAAWFAARREQLRGQRWRQHLRTAPLITPARHAAANATAGGWCIEFCPPNEEAA